MSVSRTFTPQTEGWFAGLDEDVYRKAHGINISSLKKMARSPAHYQAALEEIKEPTDSQIFGTLTHLAILEPDRLAGSYVVKPEDINLRTKDGQAWKAAQTVPILDADKAAGLESIAQRIKNHPTASAILAGGQKELSVFKYDEHTGLMLKGRLDCLTEDAHGRRTIVDVKTTDDASLDEFSRSIAKWRYDAQAAFYSDLVEAEFFVFIAVEKSAPYEIGVYALDNESIANGRASYRKWLDQLALCIEDNSWPGYPTDIQMINMPKWAMKEAA
jgi:hypothetical protein